ncbi:MAG: hypothetical protein AAFZ15_13710 [Bacteroidota bacterium]
MKSYKILGACIAFLFLVQGPGFCHVHQNKLIDIVNQIKNEIKDVEISSGSIRQSFSFNETQPWKITFYSTKITGKKGNTIEKEFLFNLSDIDINTVRHDTRKELIFVKLGTEQRQKFIKSYENNELQSYQSEIEVKAVDVDNAREIERLFKMAIQVLDKKDLGLPVVATLAEQIEWLEENVKPINEGKNAIDQSWSKEGDHPTRCKITTIKEGKKGTETIVRSFNPSDFGSHSISLQVKGTGVFVMMKVRRNKKFVEVLKDGQRDKYDDRIQINTDDIDKARSFIHVLEQLVKNADEKTDELLPEDAPLSEALQLLYTSLKAVDAGDKTYAQTIEPKCQTVLEITEKNEKEDQKNRYFFHFGDMSQNSVTEKVSGKEIHIGFKSDGNENMVQVGELGENPTYRPDVKIYAAGVENMRTIRQVLPIVLKGCGQQLERELEQLETTSQRQFELLKSMIGNIQTDRGSRRQSLAQIEESCKWKLAINEENGKKNEEIIWEFNNKDLNASSLQFNISKKAVFVEVDTRQKEKIIKTYKNGTPSSYEAQLQVQVKDIEEGRKLLTFWKRSIESCSN